MNRLILYLGPWWDWLVTRPKPWNVVAAAFVAVLAVPAVLIVVPVAFGVVLWGFLRDVSRSVRGIARP